MSTIPVKLKPLPGVRHVYRIPTRAVYLKKRVNTTASWDDVYGRARCSKCHQKMAEGDAYEVTNDGEFRHVECPEKVKKV